MRPIFADTAPAARRRSSWLRRIETLLWALLLGALTYAVAVIGLQLI